MDKLTQLYILAGETYELYMSALREAHQLNHKWKKLLNSLPPGEVPYKKWSSQARRIAHQIMGPSPKGLELDHLVPLKYLWAMGYTPEEASKRENLQFVKKGKNKRKSFVLNLNILQKIYPELLNE